MSVSLVSPVRHKSKKATGFAPVAFILSHAAGSATLSDCWPEHRIEQLVKTPNVPAEPSHHRSRQPLLPLLPGLPGLPAIVVRRREHRESGFEVLQLLREAHGQPGLQEGLTTILLSVQ